MMIPDRVLESLRPPDRTAEIQRLKDRIQELEAALGVALTKDNILHRLGLTPTQTAILGMIYRQDLLRREAAYVALYSNRPESDQPLTDNVISVYISKIRAVLLPHQVSIETRRGIGWFMRPEAKARLAKVLGDA